MDLHPTTITAPAVPACVPAWELTPPPPEPPALYPPENQVRLLTESQLRLIQAAHERAVAAHRVLIQGVRSHDWARVERMAGVVAEACGAPVKPDSTPAPARRRGQEGSTVVSQPQGKKPPTSQVLRVCSLTQDETDTILCSLTQTAVTVCHGQLAAVDRDHLGAFEAFARISAELATIYQTVFGAQQRGRSMTLQLLTAVQVREAARQAERGRQ